MSCASKKNKCAEISQADYDTITSAYLCLVDVISDKTEERV